MIPLDLYSEPFGPTGNLTAVGVTNQLGRPSMDPLTLLVRETAQNSWDARMHDWGGVTFEIRLWTPQPSQAVALNDIIFASVPEGLPLRTILAGELLADEPPEGHHALRLLSVFDRGTTGLGGPTRADVPSVPGEPRDYVDFLRNVGLPPDRPMTGGTYGYGKAAAYLASRARTICVYTRWQRPNGEFESRFEAAAMGAPGTAKIGASIGSPLTGRHWWGRRRGGFLEPALDGDADALALSLGLEAMVGEETGTALLIVGPTLNGSTVRDAVDAMVGACLFNFWPKMVPDGAGNTPIRFTARAEDDVVLVPEPADYPPLHGFVEALSMMDAGDGTSTANDVRTISSQRPARTLGRLSVVKTDTRTRVGAAARRPPAPFEEPAHHVALMRQPRLVVKYLEGPRLPLDALEYAGVFVADASVDEIFKNAEPPTHDDWVDSFVELRRDRTAIHVAIREINAALDAFASPVTPESRTGGGPIAEVARSLVGLLPGIEGPGAEVGELEGTASGRPISRHARITIVDHVGPHLLDGLPVITVRFRVSAAPETAGTAVGARAAVALDGDEIEVDPPLGAEAPRILCWKTASGKRLDSATVFVPAGDLGVWELEVAPIPDTRLAVEIRQTEAS